MKLKYTVTSRNSILYHRRYPTELKGHPQTKGGFYTKALGVKTTDTPETQLAAWTEAKRIYEGYIRALSVTNTEALAAAESLRPAMAVIRAKGHRRLLEPIGNIPPEELEMAYYRPLEESAMAA